MTLEEIQKAQREIKRAQKELEDQIGVLCDGFQRKWGMVPHRVHVTNSAHGLVTSAHRMTKVTVDLLLV